MPVNRSPDPTPRSPPTLLPTRGVTVVPLPQLGGAHRVTEDALGVSRFPGINGGHDADIPNLFERRGTSHFRPLSSALFSKNAGRPGAHRWAGLAPPSSGRHAALDAGSLSAGSRDCRSACRSAAPPRPYTGFTLPPVMRDGPLLLRHTVRVFLLLDRLALALRGEDHLRRQPLGHRLFTARARVLNEPAHRQRGATLWPHFHPHRPCVTTDAARLPFQLP